MLMMMQAVSDNEKPSVISKLLKLQRMSITLTTVHMHCRHQQQHHCHEIIDIRKFEIAIAFTHSHTHSLIYQARNLRSILIEAFILVFKAVLLCRVVINSAWLESLSESSPAAVTWPSNGA